MVVSVLLSTWVLLVSATTTQCQGVDCQRLQAGRLVQRPAATFATRAECEAFRQQLVPLAPLVMEWDAPRPLRVRKELTYACQAR